MNRLNSLLLVSLMFFTAALKAQKKQAGPMRWELAGELPGTNGHSASLGFAGSMAGVHGHRLVVAGGTNFPAAMPWKGGRKEYYGDGYVLKRNRWGKLKTVAFFRLPFALAYCASCSTPAGIVAAGGENASGISRKVLMVHWDAAAKNMVTGELPDLPLPLTNAAIAASANTVYLAGGETAAGVSDRFFCLDMSRQQLGWQELPALPHAASHAALAVLKEATNDYVYLAGGRKQNGNGISDLYSEVYAFDLTRKQWLEKKSLPYALSAGTAIAAGRGEILLFGGDRGEAFHQTEILIVAIKKETDEAIKAKLNGEKTRLQESHPGFSKTVLRYNMVADEWTAADSIPFPAPVTTTAVQWGRRVLIPGGEIRAGVRTPQILSAQEVWR